MTRDERRLAAKRALPMVDLTDLTDSSDEAAIDRLCARAQTGHGPVGAICIWPRLVSHAASLLQGTGIPIATVVNFPGGEDDETAVCAMSERALKEGAAEIDLVMPYRAFMEGETDRAAAMIKAVRSAMGSKPVLKVILETGELHDAELIHDASRLAINEGADFIKTSTGKVAVNATLETAAIMLDVIKDCGGTVGFKPAGGIKTTEDTADYLRLADDRLGLTWARPSRFRFGASGVLDDLLAALDGGTQKTSDEY
ncbi:MAG: deoxyribose-phosphate aldolase [Pseudomonadota bacterium]